MTPPAIEAWLAVAKSRDVARLEALLADDVVFTSPVVHRPQPGKAITLKYLTTALDVLGGEAFRYGGQWIAETSAVLEFFSVIDGVEVNGADFIAWNREGKINSFKVMARPLKGINALHQAMAARLGLAPAAG